MSAITQYLKIKELEIPIEIKSYKNSKSIKIYFKGNTLEVTKPKRLSMSALIKILKEDEDKLYEKYKKILASEISTIKQWKTGEIFYYKGEEFTVIREYKNTNRISVNLMLDQKQIIISLPKNIEQEQAKIYVDKLIKKLLKSNTETLIAERLPYWSKIMQIDYNEVKVRDAITRYGSCMPIKKNLYFSSRLIMLPEDKVDAIIVHELCHMKHKNHNKEFYDLVAKYIPNYKEIDKWLKINGKIIMF